MALLRSDILSKELLTRAIEQIEHTGNVDIIEIDVDTGDTLKLSQEVRRLSVKVLVRRKEKVYEFLAKLSPASDQLASQALELGYWEREQWVARELLPGWKMPGPVLQFSEKTGHATCLLFSDLTGEGFTRPCLEKSEARTSTVSLLVESLAKFHAAGYLLLQKLAMKGGPRPTFLHHSLPYPEESCLSQFPMESEKVLRLKALLHSEAFHKKWDNAFGSRSSGIVTICQGSPLHQNCLVWEDEEGTVKEATFVDFRDARCGQPATDLAILFHSWLDKDERIELVSGMLKTYHEQLLRGLQSLGSAAASVYPFSQLVEDYSGVLLPVIMLSMEEGWGQGNEVDRERDQVDGKKKVPGVSAEEIMEQVEKFQL